MAPTPKCIVASIVLAISAIMLFLSQYHKEKDMKDYVDLTLNETLIKEQILI